jgi:hypothetical protein
LDKNLLKNNPNLKWFSLSGNKISSFDLKFFSHLTNLKEFWLQHNQITTLIRDTFDENMKLEIIYLNGNKILEIERDTFKHLNELRNLNLARNECIEKNFEKHPEMNMSEELDFDLKICYINFANLLRDFKKSLMSQSTTPPETCPTWTEQLYSFIFGFILFLLLISLLSIVIMCIRKFKNAATEREEFLEMEPGVPFYCSRNILNSDAGTSSNSGNVYEFGYCADGRLHVYETIPRKPANLAISHRDKTT